MANYTQSIRNIIQENNPSSLDLNDITNITTIAKKVLFDYGNNGQPRAGTAINVISAEYREAFIQGFTLHFLNDEIGLETFPIWKLALAEKVYNNGSYINLVFDNLDKQIFADYKVKATSRHKAGTVDEDTATSVTGSGSSQSTSGTTSDSNSEYSDTVAGTETEDSNLVADNSEVTTGRRDTTSSQVTGYTGSDSTVVGSTETVGHTGTETTESTDNKSTSSASGSTTTTGETSSSENITKFSDTPQNGLSGVESGSYLTSATIVGASGEVNTSQVVGSTGSVAESSNGESVLTRDSTDTTTVDSTTTVNSANQSSSAGADTATASEQTDTDKNETAHSATAHSSVNSGVAGNTATSETSTETNSETASAGVGQKDVATEEDETYGDTTYSLNWEMLMRAEPLLNKVWDIFDDIFMLIY